MTLNIVIAAYKQYRNNVARDYIYVRLKISKNSANISKTCLEKISPAKMFNAKVSREK